MDFEFFEKVPTAANSDQISENPDRGVNLLYFDFSVTVSNLVKMGGGGAVVEIRI